MQIHGPSSVHGSHGIGAAHQVKPTATPQVNNNPPIADQLDISPAAQHLEQIGQMPDIRADRVEQLRAQIASGAYETAAKLDIAVERLLDELA
ncbi:MAG TPA: flagellar biosynthesis anti-sigma factor FlgM [Pirellulales bacterium]|nr:flagellar biosynthesis anti-sigma factor FlgM [Pirellulales bacterium]